MTLGGDVFTIVGNLCYLWLALLALWGAFCVVMVWTRVSQKRFRSEKAMMSFLAEIDEPLEKGDFQEAIEICEGDRRALPQLVHLALVNRDLSLPQIKQLVIDKFQQEILADIQHRLTWISTTIKTAPMVGLLGTVLGMMGAFAQISGGGEGGIQAEALAENIMVALITTACGLTIAIPLVLCTASVNIRIRKLEDMVSYGLTRFFEIFKRVHEERDSTPPKAPPEMAEGRFR